MSAQEGFRTLPGFEQVSGRALFTLSLLPDGPVHGGLLFVHAMGEEMNKSRHVVAGAARALARKGHAVKLVDLHGCGDSAGRLEDVSFQDWCKDTATLREGFARELGVSVHLWAMRTGALIASGACGLSSPDSDSFGLLLWQPITRGQQQIRALLRLLAAGAVTAADEPAASARPVRERLDAGEAVEIGGYLLTPSMARELGEAMLAGDALRGRCVRWIEVAASDAVSPAVSTGVEALRTRAADVELRVIQGPPFWSSTELVDCPAIEEVTLDAARALCAA